MVSVLLLFAFVMSLVINFVERTIYNYNDSGEAANHEEQVEAEVAHKAE